MEEIVKSILIYICTGGIAGVAGYLVKMTKRLAVLEEHDRIHGEGIKRIDSMSEKIVRMDVKLDLLLKGKIKGGDDE